MTEESGAPTFEELELDPKLIANLVKLGFEQPTPIQTEAIPLLLAGRDVSGGARTGSGKTAAFALPVLHRILNTKPKVRGAVRAIVLCPTRELALQVTEAMRTYADRIDGLPMVTVYGGSPYQPQLKALQRGVPIVIGTPGRVKDLVSRGALDLSNLDTFVLDEADEMLRMGFIEDVTMLLQKAPDDRQIALFSATMPPPIRRIAKQFLVNAAQVQVESRGMQVDHIEQRFVAVPQRNKLEALLRLLKGSVRGTTLVFARTRAGCAEAADALVQRGIAADALHGDMAQPARERVLARLRSKGLDVVVATDVAARGIDVEHITTVINMDLPTDTETYVHRIGRTGRAGRAGLAISFVIGREKRKIRDMERRLNVAIKPMAIPSDRAIGERRREELEAELAEVVEAGDAPEWLSDLAERREWSPIQVAHAAITLLAKARHVDLSNDEVEEPPPWARERSFGAMPRGGRPEEGEMVELFVGVGRRSGIRPGDLVGAIANDFGVEGQRIGRITIVDRKSFVGLPREVAMAILNQTDTLEVRGEMAPISIARPQPEGGDYPRRRDFDDRKGGNRGRPFGKAKHHFKDSGRRGNGPGRGRR